MGRSVTKILAIETSGSSCSVALDCEGQISQLLEAAPREHARKVLPLVDTILEHTGLELTDLDAIAFSSGPGSFTGLRIGFGIVQGLAFGSNIPVIGISTLQCMAFKAAKMYALAEGFVVPALDARMNEVYLGVYRTSEGAIPQAIQSDIAIAPVDAVRYMPELIDVAVGDGWNLMNAKSLNPGRMDPDFSPDAESLVTMAGLLYNSGLAVDILSAELSYVRNEVSWKKRERIRPT